MQHALGGFIERQPYGDLRDLILRPYVQRDTVVVAPGDLLITAYNRMKLYDISQLPVGMTHCPGCGQGAPMLQPAPGLFSTTTD